ncbi:protein PLASTID TRANSCRIPTIONALLY ACTIVE 14 isoform X3 [Magnolia sinica]|uniref:protein PLASTID TRANSCRIPTIONALLY ACTIVE 14 isoform X3 n=1 Tax=Magnolia sinica TaxID=86752 RepID=UPI002658FD6C|nr:protein PLASTID TRANSCRIPTIONALLY ACTIVE 14 isoform X3 [Magnolia sinica]
MASLPFQQTITYSSILNPKLKDFFPHGFLQPPNNTSVCDDINMKSVIKKRSIRSVKASSVETPPFRLLEPPNADDSSSELEPADPDFYKIGYVRSVRAFGVEFKEGPDGFGVYASKDVEPLRRARVIMEIPLELMLTISKKLPWMFFPDIVPIGHPIFDIINSTNPEEELTELQDQNLALTMKEQQQRALEFWEKNWHSGVPLKIKRLARDPERFIWAVSVAQTRCINLQMRIGALIQDSNMLIPYADMLNHSFQPNCFFHWRFKDRMLEVMINAGQRIRKGEEMTINYMSGKKNNILMERYGFSSSTNPWDVINFSGDAKIHLDSFLSVFNISGLQDEFYHNSMGRLSDGEDAFVDGAVIAAARTLPTWSDGDMPPIPSAERKAARELQEECQQMLAEFPTSSDEDQQILESNPQASRTLEAAIKYRLHRKLFIEKVVQALDVYQERILF